VWRLLRQTVQRRGALTLPRKPAERSHG
jgi:hypothetical protein